MAEFSDLVGKVLISVGVSEDELSFKTDRGPIYVLYHEQDCCESVTLEDICGDLQDILGSKIIRADEVTNKNENPAGVEVPKCQDSFTWTFYKIDTDRGGVTIRWYGESNGCYSEQVDFRKDNETN